MAFILTTVGAGELSGQRYSITDVTSRLGRYSLEQVFMQLSRLSLFLSADWKPDGVARQQHYLLSRLVGGAGADRLYLAVQQRRGADFDPDAVVFFHHRQILNTAKLALLTMSVTAQQTDEPPATLVEALLIVNDLIEANAEELDVTSARGRQEFELYLYANAHGNRSPHRLHQFARAHSLFIQPPSHLRSHPHYVDIPARLQQGSGMQAEDLWNALFALISGWSALAEGEFDSGNISKRKSTYFENLRGVSPTEAERWFGLACRSVAELQRGVQDLYSLDCPSYFDLLAFEQTPLVAFDDRVYCMSGWLLDATAGQSIQHRLLDPTVFDRRERRQFLDFRGALFEDYIQLLLRSTYDKHLLTERDLDRLRPNGSNCDGVIQDGDSVIIYECKGGILPLAVRTGADFEVYKSRVGDTVDQAAGQLYSTAAAIWAGEFKSLGLDPATIRQIQPLLITWDVSVSDAAYATFVERGLADHPLHSAGVAATPLQCLDIDEVETLELTLQQAALRIQLFQKTQDLVRRRLSFNNYWLLMYPDAIDGHNAVLADRFETLTDQMQSFVRSKGMGPAGPVGGGTESK